MSKLFDLLGIKIKIILLKIKLFCEFVKMNKQETETMSLVLNKMRNIIEQQKNIKHE